VRMLPDTVVLIFAVEAPDRLSRRAAAALKNLDNVRELSSISLAEIAVKSSLGKLSISAPIARQALDDLDVRVLPFTSDHAFRLFELPVHHRDPFDRQIIAQALYEDIAVVTPDRQFCSYKGLKLIW
jgi:PIN domain nuclease of toxin-antitoxin system